jgi:hypothetical protein
VHHVKEAVWLPAVVSHMASPQKFGGEIGRHSFGEIPTFIQFKKLWQASTQCSTKQLFYDCGSLNFAVVRGGGQPNTPKC